MPDKITVELSRAELQKRCKDKEFFKYGAWRCQGCKGTDKELVACHLDFKTNFEIKKNKRDIVQKENISLQN